MENLDLGKFSSCHSSKYAEELSKRSKVWRQISKLAICWASNTRFWPVIKSLQSAVQDTQAFVSLKKAQIYRTNNLIMNMTLDPVGSTA